MTTLTEVRKLKRKHSSMGTRTALAILRGRAETPDYIRDLDVGESVRTEREGFDITIRVEYDPYGDSSYLGEFTDTWAPGAIQNPHWYPHMPGYASVYRWFVPEITEDEHFEGLRQMKFGRAAARELARSYVRDSFELARNFTSFIVKVTAYRAGVELGEATLSGVDFSSTGFDDDDRAYLAEVAEEQITEAIELARDALKRLGAPT